MIVEVHFFLLVSVGNHLELRVVVIFLPTLSCFYQLSYTIFFSVQTNYLCYLGLNDTLRIML